MTTPSTPPRPEGMPEPEKVEPIGSAHRRADGVIELKLWAKAEGNILGEAMVLVKPDESRYASVKAHLGDLAPEGYKAVLPFPPGTL